MHLWVLNFLSCKLIGRTWKSLVHCEYVSRKRNKESQLKEAKRSRRRRRTCLGASDFCKGPTV